MAPRALGAFETSKTRGANAIATSIAYPPRPTLVVLLTTTLTRNPHKLYTFYVIIDAANILIGQKINRNIDGIFRIILHLYMVFDSIARANPLEIHGFQVGHFLLTPFLIGFLIGPIFNVLLEVLTEFIVV